MKKALIFEDEFGYCRVVIAVNEFKIPQESEENAIARFHQAAIPSVCEFLAVDEDRILTDDVFRDAWKRGDVNEPIKIDFAKCLEIHRNRLKLACDRKISQLTLQQELALENDDLPTQVACIRTKRLSERCI